MLSRCRWLLSVVLLRLTGYVRVFNNSGELYDNAQTRLVVGTINLVEEIAKLAVLSVPFSPDGKVLVTGSSDKSTALWAATKHFDEKKLAGELDDGVLLERKKEVKKQGLSEYFLFTIEGREDIKDKEPKRLVSMKVAEVPLECIYKLTDRDGGAQFTKFYRFENIKLLDDEGNDKDLPAMENLGLSPHPIWKLEVETKGSQDDAQQ